ncbi:60S ribosomal protein L31 [Candidatus Woesearchaeota archaeon]|nr:60S ribosomal protein L31 [Candidatus Woesearchaeota archaeon]MBW3017897.1 60S ribosomal protein L31 [Candidatus Woesearchaeota archaeon]
MAKKAEKTKALERTYNIPLRKEFQKVPSYKKTKRAVKTVREFLLKHMKADEVKLGPELNKRLWANSIKNPPHHIKVTAVKEEVDNKQIVRAELEGIKFKTIKAKAKVEKEAGIAGKLKSMVQKKEESGEKLEELAGIAEEKEKTEEKKEVKPAEEKTETKEKKTTEQKKE